MPKKSNSAKNSSGMEPKDELKETLIDDEEKDLDPELIAGSIDDEDLEDDMGDLDEDEVDPFKDKWEE